MFHIYKNVNSVKYIELPDEIPITFSDEVWNFQYGNVAVLASKVTKEFFPAKKIQILEWADCNLTLTQ